MLKYMNRKKLFETITHQIIKLRVPFFSSCFSSLFLTDFRYLTVRKQERNNFLATHKSKQVPVCIFVIVENLICVVCVVDICRTYLVCFKYEENIVE